MATRICQVSNLVWTAVVPKEVPVGPAGVVIYQIRVLIACPAWAVGKVAGMFLPKKS